MFNYLLKVLVALVIALYYLFGHVFIYVPMPCDKGNYSYQIYAGEDDNFCYYQRENANGGWSMDAVER